MLTGGVVYNMRNLEDDDEIPLGTTLGTFGEPAYKAVASIRSKITQKEVEASAGQVKRDEDPIETNHRRPVALEKIQSFLNKIFKANKITNYLKTIIIERHSEDKRLPRRRGPILSMPVSGRIGNTLEDIEDQGKEEDNVLYRYLQDVMAAKKKNHASPEDYVLATTLLLQDVEDDPNLAGRIDFYLKANFDPKFYHDHVVEKGQPERWEIIYQEIANPTAREKVKQMMELMLNKDKLAPLDLEKALKAAHLELEGEEESTQLWVALCTLIMDTSLHEFLHYVVLPKELEEELHQVLDSAPKKDIIRIEYKNREKSATKAKEYREKNKLAKPSTATDQVRLGHYRREMFCDLFSVYLKEQAGMTHIYSSVYGVKISHPTLRDVFGKILAWMQKESATNHAQVYSMEHMAQSSTFRFQDIIS